MSEPGVHRWIVETLDDPLSLTQVGPDGFLSTARWVEAVERVRLARFAHLSAWNGAMAVGSMMARGFLSSEAGLMTREILSMSSLERACAAVVMPMSERLRRSAEFDFRPDPGGGGHIEIRGRIAMSAATVVGFFQGIVDAIPGKHLVQLEKQGAQGLTLAITVIT